MPSSGYDHCGFFGLHNPIYGEALKSVIKAVSGDYISSPFNGVSVIWTDTETGEANTVKLSKQGVERILRENSVVDSHFVSKSGEYRGQLLNMERYPDCYS